MVTLIQKLINGFIEWKKATEGLTLAQHLLNIALKSNVWVWILSLIAGLVVWLIRLWNTSEDFRIFWTNMWEGFLDILYRVLKVVQLISEIFNPLAWATGRVGNTLQELINGRPRDMKITSEYAHNYTSDLNRVLSSFSSRANRNLNRAMVGQVNNRAYTKNNYNVSINNKFGDKYSERDTKKLLNQIDKELGRYFR